MTYEQAMERLAALGPEMRTAQVGGVSDGSPPVWVARKFSLDPIKALLLELGDPQNTFASVLIAGTNGKGSTAATLASITNAAEIKTGLYTSPHLQRVSERVKVSLDGVLADIADAAFGECYGRVDAAAATLIERDMLPHMPSYFEMMTAVAFCWFAEAGVELAVLEVGLGGRLDATNSVEPLVNVITDIGMDHMEYLGNTLREIATEKAGILRENGVLVTLSQHPEANAAIGEVAMGLNVRGVDAARCLPARQGIATPTGQERPSGTPLATPTGQERPSGTPVATPTGQERPSGTPVGNREQGAGKTLLERNAYPLSIEGQVLQVDSPLSGQHQQRNIALAIATAIELRTNHLYEGRVFSISNEAIERGIRDTRWPGRLEWIRRGDGEAPLLLDVAHNPAGAWTLRAALAQLPESMPRTLIFSCLRDKQLDELTQVLLPLFDASSGDPERTRDHVVMAPIRSARATPLEDLLAAAAKLDVPAQGVVSMEAALGLANAVTPQDGVIVATGSIFLVAEIRELSGCSTCLI